MGTKAEKVASTLVAREFVMRDADEPQQGRLVLSPLKLVKLVYVTHGWWLGVTGTALVSPEKAEAWPYGPVFPDLFKMIKRFGRDRVLDVAPNVVEERNPDVRLSDRHRDLIDVVHDTYRKYSGGELTELTHQPGTPWDRTWNHAKDCIENDVISRYYADRFEKLKQKQGAAHG